MRFNEKLIELRKQKGLSQEDLGNQINVSRQTISKWEAEQTSPEVEKVKELSKIFNVSIEYLLNDEIETAQEIKNTSYKEKIKKAILIVLKAILVIYLLIAIFKFGVLLTYSIKANNIAEYDNYTIMTSTDIYDKLMNESIHVMNTESYSNGIQLITHYEYPFEKESDITYINLKENKAYKLSYWEEIDKYIYNNLLDDNDDISIEEQYIANTIKDVTLENIPNNFVEILFATINPRVKVSLDEGCLNIRNNFTKGYIMEVSINSETGIVDNVLITTDTHITNNSYDYVFDNNLIPDLVNEPDLENIRYILEEELEI